jgi:hypothetical protein
MKAKARMFLIPDASTFFCRVAPISYARNPAWMITISGMVR